MKTIWIIATDSYYPSGGLSDVNHTFMPGQEQEAIALAEALSKGYDHVDVVDILPMLHGGLASTIASYKRKNRYM